mmetsp:Transcript_61557/g.71937  ORF Transcript_61557/g.71937 Transcript_61557/m.71937 type:complete len:296 (-) Transcript_61557:689-1576(-)
MGNKESTPSSQLSLEIIAENDLNYEEMTKTKPSTMEIVKRSKEKDGAFTTDELPWPTYILDNWYTKELSQFMVASPRGRISLTAEDIELLQSNPEPSNLNELADRVEEQFPKDDSGGSSSVGNGVFVRLSMCSTKRGAHAAPAFSGREVVQQIVDSQRCVQSLSCPVKHTIWLFRWNEACDITREFRVFVKDSSVVAIGTYYCAVPLPWLTSANAPEIGEEIMNFYENKIKERISLSDAVMDVVVMGDAKMGENEEIKLIEFNPLVTSGGGLFSWVDDKDLLDGMSEKAVMRIVE